MSKVTITVEGDSVTRVTDIVSSIEIGLDDEQIPYTKEGTGTKVTFTSEEEEDAVEEEAEAEEDDPED